MKQSNLIISPKRDKRELISPEWQAEILRVPGVDLVGSSQRSLQIQTDSTTAEKVLQEFGDNFNIEVPIRHELS